MCCSEESDHRAILIAGNEVNIGDTVVQEEKLCDCVNTVREFMYVAG